MNATESAIEISTGVLAAKVWGPKDGKKILALHGWLDNAATFDHLAPLLSDYRIVALDLPGHGNSSHRSPGTMYHLVDTVGALIQVLNQLGWAQANLLGHSLGAGLSSLLAGTFPERIEKLILLEALGPLADAAAQAPGRLARSLMQQEALAIKRLPFYPDSETAMKLRMKVSGFSEKAARPLVERGLKKVEGGWTWKTDPRLTIDSPFRMTEEQVGAFLERIEAPTLVVKASKGMSEQLLPWSLRLNKLRNLKLLEIEGNHHFHLEEPEPIAKEIKAFIDN